MAAAAGHVTKSQLLIGQPWEVAPSQPPAMAPQPCGKAPPPLLPHFESVKVWYAPGSLRSTGAKTNDLHMWLSKNVICDTFYIKEYYTFPNNMFVDCQMGYILFRFLSITHYCCT